MVASVSDVDEVSDEWTKRFQLFDGSMIQCTIQEQLILLILELLQKVRDGRTCAIAMNYRMKYEPMYPQEKTAEYF